MKLVIFSDSSDGLGIGSFVCEDNLWSGGSKGPLKQSFVIAWWGIRLHWEPVSVLNSTVLDQTLLQPLCR